MAPAQPILGMAGSVAPATWNTARMKVVQQAFAIRKSALIDGVGGLPKACYALANSVVASPANSNPKAVAMALSARLSNPPVQAAQRINPSTI